MNNKGILIDMITTTMLLFVAAIAVFVVYISYASFNDAVQDNEQFGTHAQETFEEQYDRFDNVWDGVIATIFIGAIIVMLIVSYVVPSNPAYYFLIMILLVIVAVIAAYLSNGFSEATSGEDAFGLASQSFPLTSFIFTNLLLITLISGVLVTIVFFAKPGSGTI